MNELLLVLAAFIFILMYAIMMLLYRRIKLLEKSLDRTRIKLEDLKIVCVRIAKELKEVRKIL